MKYNDNIPLLQLAYPHKNPFIAQANESFHLAQKII